MDNLQRHYLRLLEAAQKKALAGEIRQCLNICFDLRLKPDLALYTRAMICLMICDLMPFRSLPEKIEIANDAVKIATEPREEKNSQKNACWIEIYDELLQDAERTVKRAEQEKKQIEDQGENLAATAANNPDYTQKTVILNGEVLTRIKIPPRENAARIVGMPAIGGAFTDYPAIRSSATATTSKSDDDNTSKVDVSSKAENGSGEHSH